MANRPATIKKLVLSFIRTNGGCVDYAELEAEVLKHFPTSAFKKTHWAWYRYQCTKGRFADKLTDLEKANLKAFRRGRPSGQRRRLEDVDEPLEAVPVGPEMMAAVRGVIQASRAYEQAVGGTRKMGITGEVGELLACHHLGLRLCVDPRSEGYDAIDAEGRHVQIKTRRSESSGLPNNAGRIGAFSKHTFDYAILVILTGDYEVAEIWRAEYVDIAPLIEKQKRRNPGLAAFKKLARRVWHGPTAQSDKCDVRR